MIMQEQKAESHKLLTLVAVKVSLVSFAFHTGSASKVHAQTKDQPSILRPIALLQDQTDRRIKAIKIPDVPKKRPEKSFQPQEKLDLDATLSIVDTHYPKLLKGQIEIKRAEARNLEARGAFDPFFKHISEFKRIQDIVITGNPKNAIHNEGQLNIPTRSGVKLFGRIRVNPNDASTPFLQSGRAGEYTAGMIIPLLRGLGINKSRAIEQKAKLGEPLSLVNLNISRMNVLFEASVVYWNWITAHQKLDVVKSLLSIGQQREALVRQRVKEGDLPALAIKEAEKEIRMRNGDVIKAERQVAKAAFKLSLFLWSNQSKSKPDILDTNVPNINIPIRQFSQQEIEAGVKKALNIRPELSLIQIQKEMTNVDLKLAKNLFLPEVNLLYRQGADTGRDGIGMVFAGGVEMMVPLRQRRARGLIQQAKLKLKQLNIEEEFVKRQIRLEIEDRASELNASYGRYIQAGEEVEKASAVEVGERQRFNLGDSSLFLVNRRERERAEAERKRIDTYGDYLKALAAYKTVTGDI